MKMLFREIKTFKILATHLHRVFKDKNAMARNSSPLLYLVSPTRPCRLLFSHFQLYIKLLSALREFWVNIVLTWYSCLIFGENLIYFPVDLDFLGASEERCSEISFPSFFTCGLEAAGAQAHSRVSTEKPPVPVDNSCFSLQVSDQSRLIRLTLFESKAACVGFRDAQPRPPIQMKPHIQPWLW